MSLVRKRLKLVFYPEPEAWPWWASPWARQRETGEGRAAPLSNPMAGHLENEPEFWPDVTLKLIPGGSSRPLLPFL